MKRYDQNRIFILDADQMKIKKFESYLWGQD